MIIEFRLFIKRKIGNFLDIPSLIMQLINCSTECNSAVGRNLKLWPKMLFISPAGRYDNQ